MQLEMPIKIKEPESTPTGNETQRGDNLEARRPPEHLVLAVVMTFSGASPRLTAEEIGVVAEGDRIEEAFRYLIEAVSEQLASSNDARADLLRYPPATWFRFVAPDQTRHQPPRAAFWPEGEDVDDFIAAATEGRYEEEDEPDA